MIFLVVDDHVLIRKGLKSLLNSYRTDWEVHEAINGIQAILLAPQIHPDVVLMDYSMPKLNGAKTARQLLHDHKGIRIIMISGFISSINIQQLLSMGVKGIISKDAGPEVILNAIIDVLSGKQYLSVDTAGVDFSEQCDRLLTASEDNFLSRILTSRELEIMQLLIKGYSCDLITRELAISPKTLSAHKVNIFKKCQVHSTIELMRYAYKNNLT